MRRVELLDTPLGPLNHSILLHASTEGEDGITNRRLGTQSIIQSFLLSKHSSGIVASIAIEIDSADEPTL